MCDNHVENYAGGVFAKDTGTGERHCQGAIFSGTWIAEDVCCFLPAEVYPAEEF